MANENTWWYKDSCITSGNWASNPIALGYGTCGYIDRPNIRQDARKYMECTGLDVGELRWMSWRCRRIAAAAGYQELHFQMVIWDPGKRTSGRSAWSPCITIHLICNNGRFLVWNTSDTDTNKEVISKRKQVFQSKTLTFCRFAPRLSPLLFNGTTWHHRWRGAKMRVALQKNSPKTRRVADVPMFLA